VVRCGNPSRCTPSFGPPSVASAFPHLKPVAHGVHPHKVLVTDKLADYRWRGGGQCPWHSWCEMPLLGVYVRLVSGGKKDGLFLSSVPMHVRRPHLSQGHEAHQEAVRAQARKEWGEIVFALRTTVTL